MKAKAIALLAALFLSGCASEDERWRNAAGELPTYDITVSCWRRAQFVIFFYDQMTIKDCLESKGYGPPRKKEAP